MSNYLNQSPADVSTRSSDPEVIRRDIEGTRADLSRDVDALTEKVSPGRVMNRRVDGMKSRFSAAKDKVMGSSDPNDNGGLGTAADTASSLASSVSSSVGSTAAAAPAAARQKTQGNPLAAGLIAFGVGWLASSLLPATETEQEVASKVKDKATEHSDTLTQPLKDAATQAKDNLAEPARRSVESVKGSAMDAVGTVRDEAVSAKDDVTDSARSASGGGEQRPVI